MFRFTGLFIPVVFFLCSCSGSASKPQSGDSSEQASAAPVSSPAINASPDSAAHYDSLVKGYSWKEFNVIDSFSSGNRTRSFATTKKMIRTTYSFNTEKVIYNTGVRTSDFTATIAGFNSGHVQQKDAAMDGLVVRMIEQHGYWFLQANIASAYIHERWTVDVLFIASSEIEVIR